ncbi:uncharacterized protein LOC115314015 isoform X2 [Ixodes scapularis]|uniref:uncharacterized protein LOC115314015 isoform X2 n=1 Tax=Ixodes scapularis TaxID=6945 RepID=UPI001A9EBFE4|nr:uncharacterized protein LOC115314015 isoform X2 [Ixodes scapularis]
MLEEKAAILKLIESCPKSGRDSTPGMRPRPNHLLFVIQVLSSWVLRPADDGGFTTFPASYNGWDIIDETACSDHVGACGFPLVLTAAGTFHLATPFYVRVAPVSSTSPEPSCNAPFANLVSGRDSTPGMRPRPNHLLFVIQVLSSWVLRPADDGGFTTFPASYNGWDIIDETACSDHVGACGFPLVLTAAGTFHLATPFYVRVAPVSSTSPEPSCNAPFANLVSGRDSTPGMRPRPNHLLFVIQP